MATATVSTSILIRSPAEAIFAVLIDPGKHAAIDGTGWVCDPIDRQPLTASGQVFRMAMYHPGHPNGNYEIQSAGGFRCAVCHLLEAGVRHGRRHPRLRRLDLAL